MITIGVVHLVDVKFGCLVANTTFSWEDWPEIAIRYSHSVLLNKVLAVTLVWRFKKNCQIKITTKCSTYTTYIYDILLQQYILRPFKAIITLYSIGRPVRATITLYPIGRPVRATITLYHCIVHILFFRPPPDPPIRRQQIKGGDNVDDEVLRRKSWIGGVVRVICCRPIGEGPLDRLDKLLQHRLLP